MLFISLWCSHWTRPAGLANQRRSVRRLEEEEIEEEEEDEAEEEEEEASAGKRIKAGEGESEVFSGEKDNIHPFIPLLLLPSSAVPLPTSST